MNFNRAGDWFEISDCGAYTVAAARVNDRFKFQAWKLAAERGKTASLLGTFDEAEEARACARAHREGVSA